MVLGEDPYDEVKFWGRQMMEHALFIHLLTQTQPHRATAEEIYKKWERFMRDLNERNWQEVFPLLRELRDFKQELIDFLRTCPSPWLGWAWPSFLAHILREADYFALKLSQAPIEADDERRFWATIMGEHCFFTASLSDPYDRATIHASNDLGERFIAATEGEPDAVIFAELTQRYAAELTQFLVKLAEEKAECQLINVIHPALEQHVMREQLRGNATLNRLLELGL